MAARVRSCGAALLLALACAASPARAEPTPPAKTAAEATRGERAQALHDEAAALYERGEYRIAIAKLEEALKLDPTGRELVYNLALIHERLGDLDLAEGFYKKYLEMEGDAHARDKVQATLKRLEGAKKEVAHRGAASPPAPLARVETPQAPPPAPDAPPPPRRRYTAWVILLGSVAGTAFVSSAGFGISAIAHNPGGSAQTGHGVSIGDIESNAQTAHRDAVISDLSFVTGAIVGTAAVYLFVVGRPHNAPNPLQMGTRRAPPRVGVLEF